jgi:hypothetical protein
MTPYKPPVVAVDRRTGIGEAYLEKDAPDLTSQTEPSWGLWRGIAHLPCLAVINWENHPVGSMSTKVHTHTPD